MGKARHGIHFRSLKLRHEFLNYAISLSGIVCTPAKLHAELYVPLRLTVNDNNDNRNNRVPTKAS